jgi:hypothetical protein
MAKLKTKAKRTKRKQVRRADVIRGMSEAPDLAAWGTDGGIEPLDNGGEPLNVARKRSPGRKPLRKAR